MEETYFDLIPEELVGGIIIYIHSYTDLVNFIYVSYALGIIIEKYIKRLVREVSLSKDNNVPKNIFDILDYIGISKKFNDFKFYLEAYPGICFVFTNHKYSVLGLSYPSDQSLRIIYDDIMIIKNMINRVYPTLTYIDIFSGEYSGVRLSRYLLNKALGGVSPINEDFIRFCSKADFGPIDPRLPESSENPSINNLVRLITSRRLVNHVVLVRLFVIYTKHNKLRIERNQIYYVKPDDLFNKYFGNYLYQILQERILEGKQKFKLNEIPITVILDDLRLKLFHIDENTFINFEIPILEGIENMIDELKNIYHMINNTARLYAP